jgi:hypothetical protein
MPLIAKECTTPKLSFSLRDHEDAAIALEDLVTLTLTFTHETTGDVINSRDAQDVKNLNGVVVAPNGDVTWQLTALDTALVSQRSTQEPRRALFEFTWLDSTVSHRSHEAIALLIEGDPAIE